jgi:metallo-beta-lactamase class B
MRTLPSAVLAVAQHPLAEAQTNDIFLASHAGQFGLHRKYTPGAPHDPARFVDPDGFRAAVERLEQTHRDQLTREQGDQSN